MKRHIFAVLLGLLAVFSLAPSAPAQNATVSGDLSTIFHEQLQGDAFVRVRLRNYSGCVPRISGGGGIITETIKEVSPDATGHFSTTLIRNDFVDICGVTNRTFYSVEYWNNGIAKSTANYQCNSGTCDLNTLATFNPQPPPVNILNAVLTNPSGTQTVSQPAGSSLFVNRFENLSAADQFSSTQAAFTDAGTTGGIFIPPNYTIGTFTNVNNRPVLNLTSVAWNKTVNVMDFGATGLGAVDDYSNIHTAALAAINLRAGLYFPAGTYRMDTALTDAVFGLSGDGVQQSILKVNNSASTNSLINISAAPDGFKARGLQLDGPGSTAVGGQVGFKIANSGGNVSDAIFEDLFLKDWPNYGIELDAPIACKVSNVRVLTSLKGIFYNGGTSCNTTNSYMNSITRVGYDVKGAAYMNFSGNAADVDGMAYWIRNASQAITLVGNGHERGTARNVTVVNVALTTNVATVTYTGDDLSADFQSGMTIVVDGTTSTAGAFNGRQVPTSVTSSTIVYPLTHADVVSAADTGTACLFCGDGVVINNSTAAIVSGFYGIAAQQTYSNHVTVSGNSANPKIEEISSVLGTAGTPVAQTTDVYIGASVGNPWRMNTNLLGGVTALSNQTQTYSSNMWTIGGVSDNTGVVSSSGFIRLSKDDSIAFRNNVNSGNVVGMSLDASDRINVGGAAGIVAGPFTSNSSANVPVNGILRMVKTDTIKFRNNANSGDITALSMNGSDVVQVGGATGMNVNGSQAITGVQGTTGVKLVAATGAFTSGNPTKTDGNGNLVDAGMPFAYTFSSANKRWELFDSTIPTWLIDAKPALTIDIPFALMDATNFIGGGIKHTLSGTGTPSGASHSDSFALITTAVSGDNANLAGPANYTQLQNLQSFWTTFKLPSTASLDLRIGYTNGAPFGGIVDGVYLEALNADTNWFLVTMNTSVQTRCDTTVAKGTAAQSFVVTVTTSSVSAFVPGTAGAKCTNSTNIPASATYLGGAYGVKTQAAAAKTLEMMHFAGVGKQTGY